jgi:hypothetical protein
MKRKNFYYTLLSVFLFFVLVTTVYAATPVIKAAMVKYDNSESKSSYDNVQGAIDDLYKKAKTDSCLSVAEPVLSDELVPVTIANDGTVTMVDSSSSDWYDYCNKVWANAVILVDEPSTTYVVGDTISEDDIQSYFVWIPKYKYKLWNIETTKSTARRHTIDIIFDTNDTIDIEGISCKTPMKSGESGNCDDGEYMTHPAFISLDVNGFWVGKFETSNTTLTNSTDDNKTDINNLIIKPNVNSWRYINVYNAFMNSYNYKTNLNSHMMKNTEWGAVAYLSHSEYGINTEININNNSDYITGYSSTVVQHDYPGTYGTTSSVTTTYNTTIGYKASTTGNISGIYDMSGGSWEYMAAYKSGYVGSSGFTSDTISNEAYSKYFDMYSSSGSYSSYIYRILGDATGEMGPFVSFTSESKQEYNANTWYDDESKFLTTSFSWFYRGDRWYGGIRSSQFYFYNYNGAARSEFSFRIVLSP